MAPVNRPLQDEAKDPVGVAQNGKKRRQQLAVVVPEKRGHEKRSGGAGQAAHGAKDLATSKSRSIGGGRRDQALA
jgi:hypothetical protein